MNWKTSCFPRAFARAFDPPPPDPIWEWAGREVWLENQDAAEAGPYRVEKTPWTARLQDIGRRPLMLVWDSVSAAWQVVAVTEFNVIKSSQSGFSEAILNVIRWVARYAPRNVIYAIDSRDEAKNISARLLPTLEKLDGQIFSGDDDDVGTFLMKLRAMTIWFMGSFSAGKFANKQAPLRVADELEEHGTSRGDTSSTRNLDSRGKTAPNSLQFNLSKPKLRRGPIHRAFLRGNQEEYHIRCPECGYWQWMTFHPEEREVPFSAECDEIIDPATGQLTLMPRPLPLGQTRTVRTGRFIFSHCKDLLGGWDELAILRDTRYECAHCKTQIPEHRKSELRATARWMPTAHGTPGIISQHGNDFLSGDVASGWGRIVLEFLGAAKESRAELQGWTNHRCGLPWSEQANKTDEATIRANIAGREGDACPPYLRGNVPFRPSLTVLGSDIGLNYAKWALLAVAENRIDAAVIDWGEEIDPRAIAELMLRTRFPCPAIGGSVVIQAGFQDAKYRKEDSYKACLAVPGRRLIPCAGVGGSAARSVRVYSLNQVPTYPAGFQMLTINDREAKNELYIARLKKKDRRLWFPQDVDKDPQFIRELTAEELIESADGSLKWNEHPGANHWGDCVKLALTGLRFLTRDQSESTPAAENAS